MLLCLPIVLWSALGLAAETQDLMAIYTQALAQDPTLAAAKNGDLAAQEKRVQARALSLPSLAFSAGVSHSNTDIRYIGGSVFRNGGPEAFNNYNYSFNASQPLYRKQNSVQAAQLNTQISQAELQLEIAQQNLILRVAQAYFEVLLAQESISLIGAQKAAISRQHAQAQANFDVGTGTITDVNEAKARLDLLLAQEIAAENNLELKKRAIQAMTDQMPAQLAIVKGNIVAKPLSAETMESWVQSAEQHNLSLKLQQTVLTLAAQETQKMQAAHLPTLDAVASLGQNYATGSANGFGSDQKSAVIGLRLEIPLYQGGAITSRAREAALNQNKARDELEAVRRKTALDTRQAYLNLSSHIAQIIAYQQALTSAQSQVDSSKLGFEVGVRNSVDVLNAEQLFYSAKRDLLQARYAYLMAILQLKAATGLLAEADLKEINQQLLSP
jgi:outer membrane protein